jgi:hypothetical protein
LKNRNKFRKAFVMFLVMLLAFGTFTSAFAADGSCSGPLVTPTKNPGGDGNPPLPTVEEPCYAVRVNSPATTGTLTFEGIVVHYETYGTNNAYLKFWTEGNVPIVRQVVVKGGPNANLYDYYGDLGYAVSSDCNLVSPDFPSEGQIPGISHFDMIVCVPQTGSLEINKEFVFGNVVGYDFDVDEITVKIVGPSYPSGQTFTIDIDQ